MCLTLLVLTCFLWKPLASAHVFLQTLTHHFLTYLSILANYDKRIEDQYLQIKCRTSVWVKEGGTNSLIALRGTCALSSVVLLDTRSPLLAAYSRLLLRKLFMHIEITLTLRTWWLFKKNPKEQKKPHQKTPVPAEGRAPWWKMYEYCYSQLSTMLLNFPVCFQDYFVEWIFVNFRSWVNIYFIQNTSLSLK